MVLDVAVPEPPDLTNRGAPREFEWEEELLGSEEFYREDIEDPLQDGTRKEGFNERTEHTDLDEELVRIVSDLGLFQAFDFHWDPTDDRLRPDAPTVLDDWRGRDATDPFDSSTVSLIEAEPEDLGRTVQGTLERYLERDGEASGYGWGEEAFGRRRE